MNFLRFAWDLEDDELGNIQHIAQHGVTVEEVEEVVRNASAAQFSRSSGRPIVFGETAAGRLLIVIYEEVDEDSIYPVTAYDAEE